MQALIFSAVEEVKVTAVADPTIVDDGDAIVQVAAAGICGSDLHVYHGRETGLDAGTIMGHEFAGTIVAVGKGVQQFRPGDRICSPFTTNCGRCYYCRIGLTSRCASGQLFGWVEGGRGLHGCQAEYVRVPLADYTLVQLPEGASAEAGLLLGDVLTTGYECARRAGIRAGDSYAVIGCGPVGLMAIVSARELGAGTLFALDALPERLALAGGFGAAGLDFRDQENIEAIMAATEGRGVDAVLEAVGSPEAVRLAYRLVRPGGVIASVGVHTTGSFALSPVELYDKNITFSAGRSPARHLMPLAAPLLQKHDLTAIISHRLPLAEAERGYHIFANKLERCTKVVLRPSA